MLAEAGAEANYNGLLIESNRYWVGIAEYLLKGRFFRLLKEETDMISPWGGYLGSSLRTGGEDIAEVLQVRDKQLINRLRNENGGRKMLSWMQWADGAGKRISAECLGWYDKNDISAREYQDSKASQYLTPEQLMNYIKRQQAESYRKMKATSVLNQYEDYLSMAATLGKHMDDEMVYRPRELKRRHDEAVEECRIRQAELQAQRDKEAAKRQAEQMRQKYPGYEDILREITEKYEYEDDTYKILVPRNFMEITAEGMALHHCVGNTERYFDRIVSRETYICFLRQQSSVETPFYTIEVEPGGTIRQHRGAFDEEPEIEKIKPFLRTWQKEIRKRMSKEDHEYAKKSAVLRQKNIEELKEKNNTRVLNGLMEDLMEAI
ncbi:MAG: PcfJ domain-containing protein [Lachnospiraceae bacterium]|nr:PcfJ domain-containing protein [Lachnospiraceae bacterium]